jgi:hypothetical protein
MKDAHGHEIQGRTSWRRFAALGVPGLAGAAALMVSMASGAFASSFAVSGQQFKVSADSLEGTGFAQYGWLDGNARGEANAVAVSAIKDATLVNLCQSVVTEFPIIGAFSLNISAGNKGTPVTAKDLFVDATQLGGDASFSNIEIGRDASTLDKGPSHAQGMQDLFAQQADTVSIKDLKQVAWATNAATFRLAGLNLKVNKGTHECF